MDVYDVVLALFASISDAKTFTNNRHQLHQTFYNLSREPKYRSYLSELRFSHRTGYPYSDELDEILGSLQLTGVLGRFNPMYQVNIINIDCKAIAGMDDMGFCEDNDFIALAQEFKTAVAI